MRFMHTELRKTTNSLANLTGEKKLTSCSIPAKYGIQKRLRFSSKKVAQATNAVSSVKNAVILSFKFS